jgi:hypothetical protein
MGKGDGRFNTGNGLLIGLSVALWLLVLPGAWYAYHHLPEFRPLPFPAASGDTSKSLTAEQKGWALATSAI